MTTQSEGGLVSVEPETLKKELSLADPTQIKADAAQEHELAELAQDYVDKLLDIDLKDSSAVQRSKISVESMSSHLQKEAAKRSEMLKQPIKTLTERGEDGGEVANALVNLKVQVEELDPNPLDFEAGWMTRLLGMLPFVGTPLKRYFSRYESSSTVIDAIIRSLKNGKTQLTNDNKTLLEDQRYMRDLTFKLEKAIKLGQLMDEKLEYQLSRDLAGDEEKSTFVQEELLFPLRQRIQDLQQQLLVNQQGVLSIEMIIRNNKELIRGVNRAVNVTVSALQVAVTLALALANQKITLKKIQAVNETTSNLIAGTAAKLKQQGAEVHKMASETQIDIDALKSAFRDINDALEEVSKYRQQALPKMKHNIEEMDKLAEQAEKSIQKMERSDQVSEKFIEIEIAD